MLALGYEFVEDGVMGSLIEDSSGLGRPIMFPSEVAGKRYHISDKMGETFWIPLKVEINSINKYP